MEILITVIFLIFGVDKMKFYANISIAFSTQFE